jgi:hypothetical protein
MSCCAQKFTNAWKLAASAAVIARLPQAWTRETGVITANTKASMVMIE